MSCTDTAPAASTATAAATAALQLPLTQQLRVLLLLLLLLLVLLLKNARLRRESFVLPLTAFWQARNQSACCITRMHL
jgi:hypothetical protein